MTRDEVLVREWWDGITARGWCGTRGWRVPWDVCEGGSLKCIGDVAPGAGCGPSTSSAALGRLAGRRFRGWDYRHPMEATAKGPWARHLLGANDACRAPVPGHCWWPWRRAPVDEDWHERASR